MKKVDKKTVLPKVASFCAYRERSPREVREKLATYGLSNTDQEELFAYLTEEGFVDAERYARAYAGGRFRLKRWGRLKIRQALRQQQLSEATVAAGLSEIDAAEYRDTLAYLLDRKAAALTDEDPRQRYQKLYRYALSKGYEPDLIRELLK